MNWFKAYPIDPGFYWVAEVGQDPYLVEVGVESDSHSMFYVLLPGDNRKYPIEIWKKAFWCGPLTTSH